MSEAVTGNSFLDHLLEGAPSAPVQPRRGQDYNYPPRLYLKPDGDVVQLQGDPQNRAYYQDKGYHLLSSAPGRNGAKSEVAQWVEDEQPKVLAEQIEKARIINAIRRAMQQDRNLSIDEEDWDILTLDEMRDELQRIRTETGKDIRLPRSRRSTRNPAEVDPNDSLLRGVERTDNTSMEAVQARMQRSRGAPSNG